MLVSVVVCMYFSFETSKSANHCSEEFFLVFKTYLISSVTI